MIMSNIPVPGESNQSIEAAQQEIVYGAFCGGDVGHYVRLPDTPAPVSPSRDPRRAAPRTQPPCYTDSATLSGTGCG